MRSASSSLTNHGTAARFVPSQTRLPPGARAVSSPAIAPQQARFTRSQSANVNLNPAIAGFVELSYATAFGALGGFCTFVLDGVELTIPASKKVLSCSQSHNMLVDNRQFGSFNQMIRGVRRLVDPSIVSTFPGRPQKGVSERHPQISRPPFRSNYFQNAAAHEAAMFVRCSAGIARSGPLYGPETHHFPPPDTWASIVAVRPPSNSDSGTAAVSFPLSCLAVAPCGTHLRSRCPGSLCRLDAAMSNR